MPGERRLHGHLCRLLIANLTDHDDVRVLSHECAQPFRETKVELRLHLRLVE